MNWDALGAVGELVGAAAVVLTLAYLALQVRESSRASRQQSYNDLVTRRSNFYDHFADSDETTAILIAGCRGEKMDEVKAQRFTSLMLNYVSHFQDVYLQYKNGLVEENVWRAERQFLAVMLGLPGPAAWLRAASQYYLPEFLTELESIDPVPVVLMDQETGEWTLGEW